MVQTYEKITVIISPEVEIQPVKEEKEDQLLGDLNPRYFEETYSPKEAKARIYASQVNASDNNVFFGGF
ncbi:MAG: hypothetical protein ACXAEX_01000 [Promethearchaeota archaeon]|jgi:hypothetical protein